MRFTEEEWADYQRRRGRPVDPQPAPMPSHYAREVYRYEKEFQSWVTNRLTKWGWTWYHTHDSRRSPEGFPDLVMGHMSREIMLVRELKLDNKGPTEAQQKWLDLFTLCGYDADVWRPRDGHAIIRIISNGRERIPKIRP